MPPSADRAQGRLTYAVPVAKKSNVAAERAAKVEQMRAAQAAKERRRNLVVAGAAAVVVLVLVALVVVVVRDYRRNNPDQLALVGVASAEADCDPVSDDTGGGEDVNNHVGPGTPTPDQVTVEYETVPPSFGPHYASPAYPASPFYTAEDRPAMETLVHNLEHGYTVVWYAEDLPQAQVDQLEQISGIARDLDETGGKFIVSAWDDAYGELPDGMSVALSHWGAEQSHRQLCGTVSGEVVEQFVEDFPASDSPEPNGA